MKYAEEMYLDSQIFAGDMDGSESNFTEKIVKIRKEHTCCVCEKEIPKGTKMVSQRAIDNNGNAVIITGRKLRSIKRLQNKEQAKLRSKRDKLTKGSRQYRKYSRAIYKLKIKSDRQILDCVHKISKLYLDYCIENGISKVYYGDLDSCTRGHHGEVNRFVNQKLNDWCYGLLTLQLENKLSRYGIKMIKVSEAYSSQTCPHCGNKHKPTGRNYGCVCGYKQHRDVVGAMNILNFNEKDVHIEEYVTKKYLRIA